MTSLSAPELSSAGAGPASRRVPRTLWVLVSPRQTFRELSSQAEGAKPPRGFGLLFLWLLIEFALAYPHLLASGVFQLVTSPLSGFLTLYSRLVRYAIGPAVGVYAAGIVLYYVLRSRGRRRELWDCANIIAYAWVPHLAVMAAGGLLAGLGVDHPLLPTRGYALDLGGGMKLLKFLIELGPSLALAVVAARQTLAPWEPTAVTPRERSRAWVFATLFAALLIGAAVTASQYVRDNWEAVRPVVSGDTLPPFTLRSLDGQPLRTSELQGQVVLVDFWATWCPPCVATLPALEQLHRDYGARGFRLVSVNVEPDNTAAVRQFIADKQLTFPVYVDRGDLQARMQVHTLPTAFLVDRHGVIREVHVGAPTMIMLRHEIDRLLRAR